MNQLKSDTKINYWINFFPEYKNIEEVLDLLGQTDSLSKNYGAKQLPKELFSKENDFSEIKKIMENAGDSNLFPEAFYPIINYYFSKLNFYIDNEAFIEGKKIMKASVLISLMDRISNLGNRSFVKDLTELKQGSLLRGNSPEERFTDYRLTMLSDYNYLQKFYIKYEALFILLCKTASNYCSYIEEVIENTKLYRFELERVFGAKGHSLTGIHDLHIELGDSHQGGKAVLVIFFNDNLKVIYKPRSIDLEEKFNIFLNAINKNINNLQQFKTLRTISKGGFGWMEYVEHDFCEETTDIDYFYENIGQLTALLYFLNGKDFHHENIIASGKFPVLIDLESLFHAESTENSSVYSEICERIYDVFNNSVQSIGILPQCLKNSSYSEFISADIGGMSGYKDQLSPFKSNVIFNRNRDDIYIGKEYSLIAVQKNNPVLNGQIVQSEKYTDAFKIGFSALYDWAIENKQWLKKNVRTIFKNATNRYIAKPTFMYGQLLRTSYHPQILQSIEDRNVLLHRIGINQGKEQKKLLQSELLSLEQGDIPYFVTNVSNSNIYDHEKLLVRNDFSQSPLSKSLIKIHNINKKDKQFQLRIIDQIFSAKVADAKRDVTTTKFEMTSTEKVDKENWLELSKKIADEIISKALFIKDNETSYCTWLGLNFEGQKDEYWELDLVNNDLYLGNAGVALFFAYLGAVTKEQKYIDSAEAAANMIMEELDMITHDGQELIGAFNGISSYFYTLGKLNEVMNGKYTAYIVSKLPVLNSLVEKDTNFDMISGCSGCLSVLISLYDGFDRESMIQKEIIDIAVKCYQHICRNAVVSSEGIHWRQTALDPLVGFAHGNAGIIYSLARLYELTQKKEILSTISQALKYERQFYSPEKKGWYFSSEKDKVSLGWCNGTPGILISRLELLKVGYRDNQLYEEITIGLKETKDHGFGNNLSLCHGDFGNIEVLAYAAQLLKDEGLYDGCFTTVQQIYRKYLHENWHKGLFKGTVSYNLMVGLAGCGYSLLQAYKGYSLPKVLLLK